MDISDVSMVSIGKINLTASLASVKDADMVKEQMKLVKDSLLQNTSISAMAQGNISPKNFIDLLG